MVEVLKRKRIFQIAKELNISHNDIKMENFVFDDDRRLVLIDFGMSCFFGDN